MLILANKIMKMAEVPKIYITEKQDDPWNGERPSQDAKKKKRTKTILTDQRISKRLAVETTSLYCSCSIIPSNHSCSSLLKSKHAIPYHLR